MKLKKVAHDFRLGVCPKFCPKRKAEDLLLFALSSFLKYVSYNYVCFKKIYSENSAFLLTLVITAKFFYSGQLHLNKCTNLD